MSLAIKPIYETVRQDNLKLASQISEYKRALLLNIPLERILMVAASVFAAGGFCTYNIMRHSFKSMSFWVSAVGLIATLICTYRFLDNAGDFPKLIGTPSELWEKMTLPNYDSDKWWTGNLGDLYKATLRGPVGEARDNLRRNLATHLTVLYLLGAMKYFAASHLEGRASLLPLSYAEIAKSDYVMWSDFDHSQKQHLIDIAHLFHSQETINPEKARQCQLPDLDSELVAFTS